MASDKLIKAAHAVQISVHFCLQQPVYKVRHIQTNKHYTRHLQSILHKLQYFVLNKSLYFGNLM
jgi:hypothetical protein